MIDIILSPVIDRETDVQGVNETCSRSHGIFLKIILLARTEKPTQTCRNSNANLVAQITNSSKDGRDSGANDQSFK